MSSCEWDTRIPQALRGGGYFLIDLSQGLYYIRSIAGYVYPLPFLSVPLTIWCATSLSAPCPPRKHVTRQHDLTKAVTVD